MMHSFGSPNGLERGDLSMGKSFLSLKQNIITYLS